jgi:hypothetical protein
MPDQAVIDRRECFCHQACLKILFIYWSGLLLHRGGFGDRDSFICFCPVRPPSAIGLIELNYRKV